MRTRAQSTSLWIAALSALSGMALVFAFLYVPDKHSYLLYGMEFAALNGIAALLLNILLILIGGEQPPHPAQPEAYPPAGKRSEWALVAKRRKVLDERLQIDAPRPCSEKKLVCTCWSFCGGDSGLDSVPPATGLLPPGTMPAPDALPKPMADAIPIVDRSKVTGCPFP